MLANWKIAFWIFAECQNMINHNFKSLVKNRIFAYLWLDNAKKQCKIWKTLWLAFLTLIFFALLNNSELRSWHCSLHNWRVLKRTFDESADRRSPSTTSSSSSLVLRSRKIALLWTSPLKLLCWKKVLLFSIDLQKRSCKSRQYFYSKIYLLDWKSSFKTSKRRDKQWFNDARGFPCALGMTWFITALKVL